MTKREWVPIAELLLGAYGASRFNAETLIVWFEMLKDLAADEVRQGVETMVKTQNFPTIADIRNKCAPPEPEDDGSQYELGSPEYIAWRKKHFPPRFATL